MKHGFRSVWGALLLGMRVSSGHAEPSVDPVLLRTSCSPRDATSTEILALPSGPKEYRLWIKWWDKDRPRRQGGHFDLVGGATGDPQRKSYRAHYCPQPGSCVALLHFRVQITLDKSGKGQAEIAFETKEYGTSKIVAPAIYPWARHEPCG